jgi:hypothetical protein
MFGAVACTPGEGGGSGEAVAGESAEEAAPATAAAPSSGLRPEATEEWPSPTDSIPGTPWTQRDWEIFREVLRTAEREGLDTLPLGEAVAAMGRLFLGTPYVPRTLEVPGPERLVVNFRGLDCVTFVENVLAMTRFSRVHGVSLLEDPSRARAMYERDLSALRYREGEPSGYASRLHYFSEWLASNADAGRVTLETGALGGTRDPEPIDFMSTHADAYDQLSDPGVLASVRRVEADLNARGPRFVLPQGRIAAVVAGIRDGDVIAATSTVGGLDVAHTGLAVWVDGKLHLLHAPLVGSTVVLSERPLAERIAAIGSQDGIMVARPGGSWFGEGG